VEAQFLLPDAEDPEAAEFWAGCARNELLVQTCTSCGLRRMPPRPMCPRCRSLEFRWDEMSGRGTIWSFIVPHPPLLPAYQELAPYNVIVVALDEDPTLRMVGNLVATPDGAINEIDPVTIRIGEPVHAVFQRVEDVVLPRWMKT
jgi:uncharacterized OB-fold protein